MGLWHWLCSRGSIDLTLGHSPGGHMSESLERRALLRRAGVAGTTMVGVAAVPEVASAQDSHGHHSHGLVGAWRLTHTDDPPSGDVGTAIVTFSAGGVLT